MRADSTPAFGEADLTSRKPEPLHLAGVVQPHAGVSAATLRNLVDDTGRLFESVTGCDRLAVCRFDGQGHGEVFSEAREPHLEAYLGNRYAITEITGSPNIARRLYGQTRAQMLDAPRASAIRTAEVLRHQLWHARNTPKGPRKT